MTSINPTVITLPVARSSPDVRGAVAVARPAALPAAAEADIATQVATQVTGGMLSTTQGQSLADFFGRDRTAPAPGNLMRTANDQLDQFDRVLEKLRASLSAGATYGSAPVARTGLVVDRLA